MEDAGLLLRSREPLKGSAAPTPIFPSTHRVTLAAALLGVAGCVRRVLDSETRSREREYQRRLAQHRDDGRYVEAYLFVLDRAGDGRRA